MSSPPPYQANHKPSQRRRDSVEEERGLLSGVYGTEPTYSESESESTPQQPWSRRKMIFTASFFILLLTSGAFVRSLCAKSTPPPSPSHSLWFAGDGDLRSNGTHDFKRTVVVVSIDGFRADYLDRGLTPHLLAISKNGLRAKSMRPVFPTLTFPNHWALMTGLYAESHGIIANTFWDPKTGTDFYYNVNENAWQAGWWFGEPMWETAGKAGLITANLMWPGPPTTSSGASPTYFVPWRDHVPLDEKHDQITQWIDLPLEQRPQLITVYEPSLDQAGHATGPNSARVNQTLLEVDKFAKRLQTSLAERNLTDIVDIVFVSDHGMTDTSHPESVYIDDIIGEEGLKAIEHSDGWPAMGLRFKESANASHYLQVLQKVAGENQEKFDVYTHETMPTRYHFSHHERIAPIYVVPKIGYVLTTRDESHQIKMSKGNHGYDNEAIPMQAIFIAHGPFATDMKVHHQLGSRPKENWHSTGDSAYIMERFQNVEVYGLVMKLLGIEEQAASTNGTRGFWDKYL